MFYIKVLRLMVFSFDIYVLYERMVEYKIPEIFTKCNLFAALMINNTPNIKMFYLKI